MVLRLALLLGLWLVSFPSPAQECVAGPRCKAADTAATADIDRWSKVLATASTHMSSVAAYCTNTKVAEVAAVCRAEFTASGDPQCAALADQQAQESKKSAQAALAAAKASAATVNWAPDCQSTSSAARPKIEGSWSLTLGSASAIKIKIDRQGSLSGQKAASLNYRGTNYTFTDVYSGRATSEDITLENTTTNWKPTSLQPAVTVCKGQRQDNGDYAGDCTQPRVPFRLKKD